MVEALTTAPTRCEIRKHREFFDFGRRTLRVLPARRPAPDLGDGMLAPHRANNVRKTIPVSAEARLHTTLVARGAELRGPCPICHSPGKTFAANDQKQRFFCAKCKATGDVIALRMKMRGLPFADAVLALEANHMAGHALMPGATPELLLEAAAGDIVPIAVRQAVAALSRLRVLDDHDYALLACVQTLRDLGWAVKVEWPIRTIRGSGHGFIDIMAIRYGMRIAIEVENNEVPEKTIEKLWRTGHCYRFVILRHPTATYRIPRIHGVFTIDSSLAPRPDLIADATKWKRHLEDVRRRRLVEISTPRRAARAPDQPGGRQLRLALALAAELGEKVPDAVASSAAQLGRYIYAARHRVRKSRGLLEMPTLPAPEAGNR